MTRPESHFRCLSWLIRPPPPPLPLPHLGGGARLRAEPYGMTVTTMNNGTLVLVLSDQFVVAGNMTWVNVRIMADGPEGWVLQELLIMATPSPNW